MPSPLHKRTVTPGASIKGSVVAVHAETLRKCVSSGVVPLEVVAERLDPAELDMLCGWIHPAEWYDIGLYARLLGVLRDFDGEGSNDYLVRAGRRSADNMIRSGLYPQFEYLRRTELVGASDPHARFVAFGRDLRQLITVNATLLNFAPNHVIVDPDHPDRYVIEHIDASVYPEVLCWTSQGFCNRMAEEHDTPDLWAWERPRPDRVWYRMNRAV